MVRKTKILAPVISLKNYPNIEFNLEQNFKPKRLIKELKIEKNPKMIELHIQKKFIKLNESFIPAYYRV